jgi:Methane oxygenase PmoA
MSTPVLRLAHEEGVAVTILADAATLLRYVYAPDTPEGESPRPYAHPVNSMAGDTLSGFRPNDHPWHHGLSLTFTSVGGVNFWGGPSYRPADGYQWRGDHGRQVHEKWLELSPSLLREELTWRALSGGEILLAEERGIAVSAARDRWTLEWTSRLRNLTGRRLNFSHYEAAGLAGSHYTGLQFRGARGLLDEHGDPSIRIRSEGNLEGEQAVHGSAASWMEWHVQSDATLRRCLIRFESPDGPIPWFVRRGYPLAAFPQGRGPGPALEPGASLALRARIAFVSQ